MRAGGSDGTTAGGDDASKNGTWNGIRWKVWSLQI